MAKGKKICPKCNTENPAVVMVCRNCGVEFVKKPKPEPKPRIEKPKPELKTEKVTVKETINPKVAELMRVKYEQPKMLTPDEHADRILGLGNQTAHVLLLQARNGKRWRHVNWKRVAEKIGAATNDSDNPVKEEE